MALEALLPHSRFLHFAFFCQHSLAVSSVLHTAHPSISLSEFILPTFTKWTLPATEWKLRIQQLVQISSALGNLETHFESPFPRQELV